VEATRVGRVTDFDKLILELWTDGTTDAMPAIEQAARVLVGHFKQVYDPIEAPEEEKDEVTVDNENLKLTVEELDIPTRIANALRKGGYKTVGDLVNAPVDEVTRVKNLGEKSVEIVAKALEKKGVKFGK
jgi:DNA-directed RNA polymerase subunit alpha